MNKKHKVWVSGILLGLLIVFFIGVPVSLPNKDHTEFSFYFFKGINYNQDLVLLEFLVLMLMGSLAGFLFAFIITSSRGESWES